MNPGECTVCAKASPIERCTFSVCVASTGRYCGAPARRARRADARRSIQSTATVVATAASAPRQSDAARPWDFSVNR